MTPRRYIAHYADGSRHELEATSKAGATRCCCPPESWAGYFAI